MKKILSYAERSRLMDITLKYGDDKFKFNLYEELVVNENRINFEIQEQPNTYAFLAMLHKKLLRIAKDNEQEVKNTYSRLYLKLKDKAPLSGNNRGPSKDALEAMIIKHSSYTASVKALAKAEDDLWAIEVCVKSFEQRKDLIQSLSANIRKENHT